MNYNIYKKGDKLNSMSALNSKLSIELTKIKDYINKYIENNGIENISNIDISLTIKNINEGEENA